MISLTAAQHVAWLLGSATAAAAPAAAAASSTAAVAAAAPSPFASSEPYLRGVCRLQAWVRGVRARRVLCIDAGNGGLHSLRSRALARQAVRTKRSGSIRSPTPPRGQLQPSPPPPVVALPAAAASGPVPARRLAAPPGTPSAQTPASIQNGRQSPSNASGPGGSRAAQQLAAQSSSLNSRSAQHIGRVPAVAISGGAGSAARRSPSPSPDPLSLAATLSAGSDVVDLEIERASEGASAPGAAAAAAVAATAGLSAALFVPLCVVACEARLASLRRAAARPLLASAMSAAQLLEERKLLRRELQQARERHQPLSSQTQSKLYTGSGAHASSRLGGGGGARVRARSLSPAPNLRHGASILCDSCASAGQSEADWRQLYHPLLLQYKLVNAALQAKGVLSPTEPASSSPSPSPVMGAAAGGGAGGGSMGLGRPLSANSSHSHAGGGGGAAVPLRRVGSLPIVHGSGGLTGGSGMIGSSASTPTLVGAMGAHSSSSSGGHSVAIVRSRGVRKPLGGGSGGSSGVGGGGGSVSAPVSRTSSGTNSPVLGPQASAAAAAAAAAGANQQFAQWSLQSQLSLQQAQLPPSTAFHSSVHSAFSGSAAHAPSTSVAASNPSGSAASLRLLKSKHASGAAAASHPLLKR